jgi:hypothetical protein
MAVGWPTKTTYATGDVYQASDVNDTNGTINLLTSSTLSLAAGKNGIINGGMDIWQRGTSIAGAATAKYTADRFSLYQNTAATVTRQATSDTTNLPSIQYCLRAQRNSGSTSTSGVSIAQSVESANSIPFAGKSVVYSFYARRGANFSGASNNISVYLVSGTGTDQNIHTSYTGASYLVNSTATLTTTWQRFTFTATVAGTATELAAYQEYTPSGTAGANDYFEITGVQLELGSTATTFSRAGGTIQGELAACQRYYYRAGYDNSNQRFGTGAWNNPIPNRALVFMTNPVMMRTAPSSTIDYANLGVFDNNSTFAVTSLTMDAAGAYGSNLNCYTASGSVAYRPVQLVANGSTSAYIGFSAEL